MPQLPSKHEPGRGARPADAIRQLVVPQVAPPYDDEPDEVPTPPRCDTRKTVSLYSGDKGTNQYVQNNHGASAGAWPGQFAQVLAETLAGSRPARQLAPWTTEPSRRQIRQLGPLFATGERPLVRRIMTAAPASGVLELTAVVGLGPRVRVLALRLERQPSGRTWCCTAIESA
jgi:hypothetical protein